MTDRAILTIHTPIEVTLVGALGEAMERILPGCTFTPAPNGDLVVQHDEQALRDRLVELRLADYDQDEDDL